MAVHAVRHYFQRKESMIRIAWRLRQKQLANRSVHFPKGECRCTLGFLLGTELSNLKKWRKFWDGHYEWRMSMCSGCGEGSGRNSEEDDKIDIGYP